MPMEELFTRYSATEIIVFLTLLAGAFKGFMSFWDWFIDWLRKKFDKEYEKKRKSEELVKEINSHTKNIAELTKTQTQIKDQIKELHGLIHVLIDSDRDDIKSWITEKHHYFCYNRKVIDDYSLDCIEKRYEHYKDEGGNSYIDTLMSEIRALPKVSVYNKDQDKK
jgi:enoyl-[acyl-carrier-protein] reductase (NADH)